MLDLKVLLVEDDLLIQQEMKQILENQNCQVFKTDNADSALEILNSEQPEIVLMDIQIKGKQDGIGLAKEINRIINVPIIFISDFTDDKTVARATEVKPANYLVKPFTERQIVLSIGQAIKNFAGESVTAEDFSVFRDSIFVKVKGDDMIRHRVKLDDITFLQASRSYSIISTASRNFMLSFPLKGLLEKLPANRFVKIHKSHAINPDHITGIKGNNVIINDMELRVSDPEFLNQLKVV